MNQRSYDAVTPHKVAFLGLGVMGYPMAGHLKRAGHEVTVYNRTSAKADQWAAEHAPGNGYVADARTVWDLAQAWYGDRLNADFQPHSREFNQALLAERGLNGAFWRLP